jgi:dTDP-4-amino-4,6-dideoxygalactose transaminase
LPEGFALPADDGADGRFYHVYNQFVVRAPRRDELAAYLDKRSIGSAVYYPKTLAQQPSLAAFVPQGASFPNAEAATRDSLALPIFPGLTEAQQAYVVEAVADFYSEG